MAGSYPVVVENPAIGFTEQVILVVNELAIGGITPTTISQGGELITIAGNGFNVNMPPTVWLGTDETLKCTNLIVVSPSSIICRTPQLSSKSNIVINLRGEDSHRNIVVK